MNVKLLTISVFILLIFTSIFPIVNSMKVENKLEEIQIDINSEKKLKPYFPGISELDPNALYYYPYELILIFNKDYVDVENQKQFFGYNFTDVNPEINGALIEVPESEVEFLQQIIDHLTSLPQVEYANLNILDAVDPPNIVASSEKVTWGQETINCPGAWEISKGNSDVSIAIIDTGIDYHKDIKKPKEERDFVQSNWWKKDTRAEDLVGRGTNWAGIIFGKHDGTGIEGVVPDCTFYSVKVTDDKDGAIFSKTDVWRLARGIIHAASTSHMNADVLLIALTAELDRDFCLPIEIACGLARNVYHSVIIASSGCSNGDSKDDDVMSRIATYNTTVCVGAIDSKNNRYKYSPYGKEVDIVAPGVNIYTTNLDDGYEYIADTGAAAAFVAGTAALYFSEHGIKNPKLKDVQNCEEALKENANSLGGEGESDYFGEGLIDTYLTTRFGRRLVMDFTWAPKSPKVGEVVVFTHKSYDPDGGIDNFAWDFENDERDDNWDNPASHIYLRAITHECELWVKADDGESRQYSQKISVQKGRSVCRYNAFLSDFPLLDYLIKNIKN